MRLIRQKAREYQGKEYFKYLIVVPNKVIDNLGWDFGEQLAAEVKQGKLIIRKEEDGDAT